MDDIHLDDPRKYSAKQLKQRNELLKNKRTLWKYLFDLIVKTIICTTFLGLNFTLFANSGSYTLFSSSFRLNAELEYIYIGIAALSFLIMFVASFYRKLENIILAVCFAGFCVATINQFATFEKKSGLLIAFNGVFSDSVNAFLYEYSLWVIGGVAFIFFWLLLRFLSRQFLFYFMLIIVAFWGWILSEAYLNSSVSYFRMIASAPILRTNSLGKNIVFLSFNGLTSPNNLREMYNTSPRYANILETFNNSLAFYTKNNFTLYPNVLLKDYDDKYMNLISFYNPDMKGEIADKVQSSAVRNDYFNFSAIQKDKMYLKESSLYDMLRKDSYTINVHQTSEIDTCYLNNKVVASSCKEKVNAPINFANDNFSLMQKVVLLVSQWVNSTGFVPSINPLLRTIGYVYNADYLQPLGFDVNNLGVINSFKALDQIIDGIDQHSGNQVYFAVVDIPSDTYVYDAFCKLKPMAQWSGEGYSVYNKISTDERRSLYAEQVDCLYGYLEKFMQQLDRAGHLEDTTIIITGLNNPEGLNKPEKNFYRQLQAKKQSVLAIRPAGAKKYEIDYSVCLVSDVLNSFFFTKKPCNEFVEIKTTDKILNATKKQIDKDKYKNHTILSAQNSFKERFKAWSAYNQFDIINDKNSDVIMNDKERGEDAIDVAKVKVIEKVVEDIPEKKMPSISVVADQKEQEADQKLQIIDVGIDSDISSNSKVVEPESKNDVNEDDVINERVGDSVEEEVIPPTLLNEEKIKKTEDAIIKAKQALLKKEEDKKEAERVAAEKNKPEPKLENNTSVKNDYDSVLTAPIAEGQNLSPEELKKQYRELLRNNKKQSQNIDIQIKVVEN